MKYLLVEEIRCGDVFVDEFDTAEEAIKTGRIRFSHLTDHDIRRLDSCCVLESINPDPESENHLDGDIVFDFLTWYAVEQDADDNDWGTGSNDFEEAKEMLKDYPDGKIAVIQLGADPVCVREIPYSDIFD